MLRTTNKKFLFTINKSKNMLQQLSYHFLNVTTANLLSLYVTTTNLPFLKFVKGNSEKLSIICHFKWLWDIYINTDIYISNIQQSNKFLVKQYNYYPRACMNIMRYRIISQSERTKVWGVILWGFSVGRYDFLI